MIFLYLMIFFLFLSIGVGCLLVWWKWKAQRRVFYAIFAFILGVWTIVFLKNIIFIYDDMTLEVSYPTHSEIKEQEIYLKGLMAGDQRYDQIDFVKQGWLFDGEYYIYSEKYEGLQKTVDVRIPVGKERSFILLKGPNMGLIEIQNKDTGERWQCDLSDEQIQECLCPISDSGSTDIFFDNVCRLLVFCILTIFQQLILLYLTEKVGEKYQFALNNRKVKYFLFMMTGFLLQLIHYLPLPGEAVDQGYQDVFYFESYEFGFFSRGLIGEIMNQISPYWTIRQLYIVKLMVALSLFTLIAVIVSEIVSRWKGTIAAALTMGLILSFPSVGLTIVDGFRIDIFIYLIYIGIVILLHKQKGMCFIPLLCVWLVLINETTCMTVIPSVLALIICCYCIRKEKRYLFLIFNTAVFAVLIAAISVILGKGNAISADIAFADMQQHYEGELAYWAMDAEYWKLADQVQLFQSDFFQYWQTWIIFLLTMIPMAVVLTAYYRMLWREKIIVENYAVKVSFGLLCICSFSPLSAMMIAIDYPRYLTIMFLISMANFFFLVSEWKIDVNIKKIYLGSQYRKEQFSYYLGIIIFYACYGPFHATIMDTDFMNRFVKWFEYFSQYRG